MVESVAVHDHGVVFIFLAKDLNQLNPYMNPSKMCIFVRFRLKKDCVRYVTSLG